MRFDKLTIRPISHRVEGDFTVHQLLNGLVPRQVGVIRVDVVLHLGEITHRLFHLGIIPFHLAAEEVDPPLCTDDAEKRVLEKLRGSPNAGVADADGRNASRFQLVTDRKEIVKGHVIADLDAILIQEFFVVPKNVPMMDAG